MIRLEGITKSFGSLQVLRGIDLEIKKGRWSVLSVPAVRARPLCCRGLFGTLDMPDSGSVMIDGTLVNCLKEKELSAFRNKHIGFVFQFHQLLPEFTGFGECNDTGFHCRNGTAGKPKAGGLPKYWTSWDWRNAFRTSPMSCPVARSKGLPLPVRSSIILRWCWRISRQEVWDTHNKEEAAPTVL